MLPRSLPPLSEMRGLAQASFQRLPLPYRGLEADHRYPMRWGSEAQARRTHVFHLAGETLAWTMRKGATACPKYGPRLNHSRVRGWEMLTWPV